MKHNKALRVALVWNGTVMTEKTFNLPSEYSRVTIGEAKSNTFNLAGQGVPEGHVLFQRQSDGNYDLHLLDGMTGRITVDGREINLADGSVKNIGVKESDWGVIHYHRMTFFFQFVDASLAIPGRGFFRGGDATLTTALWFSLIIQLAFVFACRVIWDEAAYVYELDPRFQELLVMTATPPDELEDVLAEDDLADDEDTSARAPDEEGEFGDLESDIDDSILPDHDGPLVDQLESTELGRAFDTAIAQSGALSRMFDNSSFMAGMGHDFATAGEGDAYVVGRGSGGLGMRGTGRGGGGRGGFGRVHGVGAIDSGGGRGVTARMGQRGQRAPRARVDRGEATVSGFLSREQIERVVRRHARGIRYCYERVLQDNPILEGQIVANWTIDLDGQVSRRSIESNTMGNRDVESCLLREIGRMRFDQPDGGMVIVRYPFTFRGAGD